MKFKEFSDDYDHVEYILNEFNNTMMHNPFVHEKTWSAKKKEIIQTWQNLRPDVPILITPIDNLENQESYGEDGIRISGSWQFITSVMGRLKDLITYENPHTRLRLILREVKPKGDGIPKMTDRPAFVFYLNVERRGSGHPGRPKKA